MISQSRSCENRLIWIISKFRYWVLASEIHVQRTNDKYCQQIANHLVRTSFHLLPVKWLEFGTTSLCKHLWKPYVLERGIEKYNNRIRTQSAKESRTKGMKFTPQLLLGKYKWRSFEASVRFIGWLSVTLNKSQENQYSWIIYFSPQYPMQTSFSPLR